MAESSGRSRGVLGRLRSAGRGLRRTMFGCVTGREADDRDDGRRPTERPEAEEPVRQPTPQPAVTADTPSEERPDEAGEADEAAETDEAAEAAEADEAGQSALLAEPEDTSSPVRRVTIVAPSTDAEGNLSLNEPGINWHEMVEERDIEEESDTGSMTTHIPDLPDLGSVHDGDDPPMRSTATSSISGSVGESSVAHSTAAHGLKHSVLGRISLPSKSAQSADSDNPTPVIAEEEGDHDFVEFADAPAEAHPLNLGTETSIAGLAKHETSGKVYVLITSGSDSQISRLRPGEKVPDLSFVVASETNKDVRMTVVEDHIVTSSKGQLLVYNLDGVREKDTGITRRVMDVAGRQDVVYTLLENGEVASYTVAELQRIAVVRPDSRREITRALRLAMLQRDGAESISVILAETYTGGFVINFYAATNSSLLWDTCLTSILTQSSVAPDKFNLCFASVNEVMISHHTLLLVNYVRSTSKRILLDKITTLCSSDNDHALIARNNQIEMLDLKEARGTLEYIDPTFDENVSEFNVDDNDSPSVRIETRMLWRLGSSGGIHRIAVNKQSGELIGMSRLGYVIVYGRDFTRPVDNYQLAFPEGLPGVWRIDTTDEGEVIVISDRSVMIFSHDRQLRWRDDLPTLTWMVVCQGEKMFVLLNDEIVVYTIAIGGKNIPLKNWDEATASQSPWLLMIDSHLSAKTNTNLTNLIGKERQIMETTRIPLAVGDVDPRNARLAVHGDTIYFIPLRQTIFVTKAPLTGPFHRFARLPLDNPDCMCVDEKGRLIVGGWSESRGAEWRGFNIFAPDGTLLRELQTADSIYEVAACPGGGIFLRTSAGLRFMENYV